MPFVPVPEVAGACIAPTTWSLLPGVVVLMPRLPERSKNTRSSIPFEPNDVRTLATLVSRVVVDPPAYDHVARESPGPVTTSRNPLVFALSITFEE